MSAVILRREPAGRASKDDGGPRCRHGRLVYMLRCADDSYYRQRHGDDLAKRIAEHQTGAYARSGLEPCEKKP